MISRGLLDELRQEKVGLVHREGTHCMEGGEFACLLMGNIDREAWVSPWSEERCCPIAHFCEITCSLEGSRTSQCAKTERGGVECLGKALNSWEGRRVYMPFDGQRRTRGMGEPPSRGTMSPIGTFF